MHAITNLAPTNFALARQAERIFKEQLITANAVKYFHLK